MRFLATVLIVATAAATTAGADPIADCRAAHAGDSAAHIACLENALRTRQPAATAAPTRTASGVAPPAAAGPVAAAPAAAAAASAPAEPTGLGAEQAKARLKPLDAPPEQMPVRIVSARYTAEGLGIFTMADGQVWRETTPSVKRYQLKPGREYPGRIETSKIGGYRLYIEDIRWMYKVERLK